MRKFTNELKRVVIKVGSSSITHKSGEINLVKIAELAWELSNLRNNDIEVVLVSSGAIAAGAKRLNLPDRPRDTIGKQAAASVGQVALMQTYSRAFSEYNYMVGQILVTKQVETDPTMNENARNTFHRLLSMNTIPIVNENDTVSTFEIEFGDNDTLSAVVARLIEADLLIMLSDIDGLFDKNPAKHKDAKLIREVTAITEDIKGSAEGAGSSVGTGGMTTKINAASICMDRGIDVVIANSENLKVIRDIVDGEEIGTIFRGNKNVARNREKSKGCFY